MEEFTHELIALSEKKRLFPAEEVISSKLVNFEKLISTTLSKETFENLEKALINILSINQGNLSMSCSIRVATCLSKLYNFDKSQKLWNINAAITKSPTQALVYATGYVIKKNGQHSKSLLSGIVKTLLGAAPAVHHASLFAIRACYQISPPDLKSLAEKIFTFARKDLQSPEEPLQLAAIKLLRTMLRGSTIPIKKFLHVVEEVFKSQSTAFVNDEACYLAAKCAYLPLKSQDTNGDVKEFSLKSKSDKETDFSQTFQIFTQFKSNFSAIFRHFLDLVTPQFLYENLQQIFSYVRKNSMSDLPQILSTFSTDVKSALFEKVAAEQPPTVSQLQTLRFLITDKTTANEAAAVSLQLSPQSEEARQVVITCFAFLSEHYPRIASMYLETAVLFLARPPADSPDLKRELAGFAAIATGIFGGSRDPEATLRGHEDDLIAFLTRALGGANVFSADYSAAFQLMATLPRRVIPLELAGGAVGLMAKHLEAEADLSSKELKEVVRHVASFVAAFPETPQSGSFIAVASRLSVSNSATATLGIALGSASALAQTSDLSRVCQRVLARLLAIHAQPQSILSTLGKYMAPAADLLFHAVSIVQAKGRLYQKVNTQTLLVRAFEAFPSLVASLRKEDLNGILSSLYTAKNQMIAHSLILKLIRDERTAPLLPSNLHSILLETLETEEGFVMQRAQITAECIGLWASIVPGAVEEILAAVQGWRNRAKCFVLSALFSHAELTNNQLVSMMHELDDIAKNTSATACALFSLGSLFDCHAARLATLQVTDIQCRVILSLLNTHSATKPYEMYFLSVSFSRLLPILSPDLQPSTASLILQIIQVFNQTELPFSKQIMFHTARAVTSFMRSMSNVFVMRYPSKPGSSLSLQLAACGAIADALLVSDGIMDYFGDVPSALMLRQRRDDPRPEDFVVALASNFVAHSEPSEDKTRASIVEWVKLIKTVLSASSMPNFGSVSVEPNDNVRRTCVKAASRILELISASKPLLGECLDDIVTSATRASESECESLVSSAYNIFVSVIERFCDVRSEDGTRLINLYESQFASVVKSAFSTDYSISGPFLTRILDLTKQRMHSGEDTKTITSVYLSCLETCELNHYNVLQVVSDIIQIAMEKPEIGEPIKRYGERFIVPFEQVIKHAIDLYGAAHPDFISISNFKQEYPRKFGEVISSYVWLRSIFGSKGVTTQVLVKFCNDITSSADEWWVSAGITGLSAVLEYESVGIEEDVLANALSIVKGHPSMQRFVLSCARRLSEEQTNLFDKIMNLLIEPPISLEAIALLIMNGNKKRVSENARTLSRIAYDQESLPLVTILFDSAPEAIAPSLDVLFDDASMKRTFKRDVVQRAVRRSNRADLSSVALKAAEFAWTTFRAGGMQIIADALLTSPPFGLLMFEFHGLSHLSDLVVDDVNNAAVYLHFAALGLGKSPSSEVVSAAATIAVRAISKHGSDTVFGTDIINAAAALFGAAMAADAGLAQRGFEMASAVDQQVSLGVLDTAIQKSVTRSKVRKLKTFSSNVRKAQDSEWMDL